MAYFPMMVDLSEANVLVVGGGKTAARKAKQLMSFGALCHVIAPETDPEFDDMPCETEKRRFQEGDIERLLPLAVVIAATDDHELNHKIGEQCARLGLRVNVVDDPELSSFIFPSIVSEGDVLCAVTSGGKSPLVSQYIKGLIEQIWPRGIGKINDEMGRYKDEIMAAEPDITKRRALLKAKMSELLDGMKDA